MKKLISVILALGLLALQAPAQQGSAILIAHIAGDTLTTTAGKDSVTKIVKVSAGYNLLSLQVVTTKISGTVVGKAYVYGSHDGVNYVISDSSSAFANQTTNTAQFGKSPVYWTYYKFQVREADGAVNTQANDVKFYYALRKFD